MMNKMKLENLITVNHLKMLQFEKKFQNFFLWNHKYFHYFTGLQSLKNTHINKSKLCIIVEMITDEKYKTIVT